jgi:hypothetical protein
MVIKLDGVSCDSDTSSKNAEKLIYNELLNGGCEKIDGKKYCYFLGEVDNLLKWSARLVGKCREGKADMVFMFLTAGLFIGTALMLFLKKRKGY